MLSSDDALDGCVGTMRRLREEFAFALRSGPRVPRWSLNNTGARHSRHARSRSHHGHRSATVTPESLQAAGKLSCATTLATAASSDFFCVPFGGRANGGVSTPLPTPSPTTAAPAPSTQTAPTADCGPRFPPLHPCAPRRATGHPTPIATTVAPARVPPGPGRQHVGPDHRLMCTCGNKSDSCVY